MSPQQRLTAIGIIAGNIINRGGKTPNADAWRMVELLALGSQEQREMQRTVIARYAQREQKEVPRVELAQEY